ncbi:MAG: hypothetical protein NVS3B18_14000 [Candidatus Dormibacteria bacterium]
MSESRFQRASSEGRIGSRNAVGAALCGLLIVGAAELGLRLHPLVGAVELVPVLLGGMLLGRRFLRQAASQTPEASPHDGSAVDDADVLQLPGARPSVEVLGVQVVDEAEFTRRTALLSRRQREVVRLAISGLTARHIGARLFISERTVETHLANAYDRLDVHSRAELIAELRHAEARAS